MRQILCIGDSNTYGLIPGTTRRFAWGTRWTSILDERMRDAGYRVVEEGLCGRTTVFDDPLRDFRCAAGLLPTLLETHNPVDAVVLMLGTNDCKAAYGASAEVIGKGIDRLLEQIYTNAPGTEVLLISPIHLGEGVGEEDFDPEFNENSVAVSKKLPAVYQKIAAKRNAVLKERMQTDGSEAGRVHFLAASDYADPSKEDREHLDAAGHQRLAQAVYQALSDIL